MAALKNGPDLAALVGEIYDAATDRSQWERVLARVTAALSGTSAVLFSPGGAQPDEVVQASHGIDPSFQQLYERHYYQHDVLLTKVTELRLFRAGWTACCEEYFDRVLLERSTYYNEFLKPCDTGGVLSMGLLDGESLRAPPTALSIYRPTKAPLFDARAMALAKLLAPHLQRALLIHWRLALAEVRAQSSEAVLDRLEHGVMQLSADGRVLYANATASRALSSGLSLRVERGVLTTRVPGYVPRLRDLLHHARNGLGGLLHLPSADGGAGTLIVATPLPFECTMARHPESRILVLISGTQHHVSTRAGLLAHAHGLTPAETRVLKLLAGDCSPAQIAESLGTRIATVRSQLKSIYMKLGVHGQREMLVLVAKMPSATDIKT